MTPNEKLAREWWLAYVLPDTTPEMRAEINSQSGAWIRQFDKPISSLTALLDRVREEATHDALASAQSAWDEATEDAKVFCRERDEARARIRELEQDCAYYRRDIDARIEATHNVLDKLGAAEAKLAKVVEALEACSADGECPCIDMALAAAKEE